MTRSDEARKPRAESRVRVLADENAALRVDRSNLETRVKELRAELDAAAKLHREVKARLTEEREYFKASYSRKLDDEKKALEAASALEAENTRLSMVLHGAKITLVNVLRVFRGDATVRSCTAEEEDVLAQAEASIGWIDQEQETQEREAAPPASDKSPFRPPEGTSDKWSTGEPRQ